MSEALLNLAHVSVSYGQIVALDDIDLTIGKGEIVALVGSNGAGKTTLIKTIVGLLDPNGGMIEFEGRPLARMPVHRRARLGIGYSPEGRRVFPGLSVQENLEVAATAGAKDTIRLIDEIYAIFPGLAQKSKSLGWTLSGGQQQMLAIGRALMVQPRLLLLDEPSLGLSPKLTDEVLFRIPDIVAGGTSALLAEQNMLKALEISHRAYVLRNGRIVRSGRSSELRDDNDVREAFLGGR